MIASSTSEVFDGNPLYNYHSAMGVLTGGLQNALLLRVIHKKRPKRGGGGLCQMRGRG